MILYIKSLIFSLIVPGSVAVLVPQLIAEKSITSTTWFNNISGVLFLAFGFAIYCWCVWGFITLGKGTPAPIDAPKHLVVKGLYHYTRNPMYVGILFAVLGWALFYTSLSILVYGIFITVCFQILVVFYEEPMLQQLFGSSYIEYKNIVNRWLPI